MNNTFTLIWFVDIQNRIYFSLLWLLFWHADIKTLFILSIIPLPVCNNVIIVLNISMYNNINIPKYYVLFSDVGNNGPISLRTDSFYSLNISV